MKFNRRNQIVYCYWLRRSDIDLPFLLNDEHEPTQNHIPYRLTSLSRLEMEEEIAS
jgi:hypothetical protein